MRRRTRSQALLQPGKHGAGNLIAGKKINRGDACENHKCKCDPERLWKLIELCDEIRRHFLRPLSPAI